MAVLLDDDNAMIAANFVRGKTASGEEEEPASSWLGCLNCIADIDASLFLNPFQLMVRWTQISKLFFQLDPRKSPHLIQTLVVPMET
jgi:hypothetical protein